MVLTSAGPVAVRQRGTGPAVLLSHGGQTNMLDRSIDAALPVTAARLIVPSRPGYSGTPLAGRTTPAQSADVFAAVLDTLAIDTVVAIGLSLGARPAIELAARHPDRVRALVVGSAVHGPFLVPGSTEYRVVRAAFGPRTEQWVWSGVRASFRSAPRATARVALRQLTTVRRPQLDHADARLLAAWFHDYGSGDGFRADLDHALSPGALAAVRCPTLVQHSANDNSVALTHAQALHDGISGSELRVYDNAWGHFLWTGPGSQAACDDLRAHVVRHSEQSRCPDRRTGAGPPRGRRGRSAGPA